MCVYFCVHVQLYLNMFSIPQSHHTEITVWPNMQLIYTVAYNGESGEKGKKLRKEIRKRAEDMRPKMSSILLGVKG